MAKTIERTAIAPFQLAGQHVPAGKPVQLTSAQFKRAVFAGVVHASDEDNATVPVVHAATQSEAVADLAGNEAHAPTAPPQEMGLTGQTAESVAVAERLAREQAEAVAEQARKDAEAKRQVDLATATAAADADRAAQVERERVAAEKVAAEKAEAERLAFEKAAADTARTGQGRTNAPPIPGR